MNTADQQQAELATLRAELAAHLAGEREHYFGATIGPEWIKYAEDYFWEEQQQDFRLADLQRYGIAPGATVLDLAAGCGQFVLHALRAGYQAWGIEPSGWKVSLVRRKWHALGADATWHERVLRAVGERLPFADNSFDAVSTLQTLEHVDDPDAVVSEMLRVARPGGGIYIRCPDYRSTFEAHYQLPWLPLFPRALAKAYLRLLGRPTAGLDTIRYVTLPSLRRAFRQAAARQGCRIEIHDDNRREFNDALKRRGLPQLPGLYAIYRLRCLPRELFRVERSVNLFVRVVAK